MYVLLTDFLFRTNPQFMEEFINVLENGTPRFEEYYFGCPPISSSTVNLTKFEFILKKSKGLNERTPSMVLKEMV